MGVLDSWEVLVTLGSLLTAIYLYDKRRSSKYPLPPGPRRLPIVGNLFDLPPAFPWKVYTDWGKTYNSDILYLNAVGRSIVILNSYEAAKDLLERRSAIYSSRPTSIVLSELSGFGFQFGLMPYGDPWRVRRRLFRKHFSPSNSAIYELQAVKYVRCLLHQLLEHRTDLMELIPHMVGSISLSMTYGVDILPENDPNMELARRASKTVNESLSTGSRFVDLIPVLKYFPAWFPGASFQRLAADSRIVARNLREGIFAKAQEKWLSRASPNPSFVSLCLDDCDDEKDEEQLTLIKDVAGIVYMAASNTTTVALKTFILAMVCFPEVQKRAQRELDRVLEGGRLPNHSDVPLIPYISALVKEVLRWQAAVPGGVAHKSTSSDVYRGYYIPSGSTVIFNTWAMLHNEVDYPEPREFRPERFLTSEGLLRTGDDVRDPVDIIFGFGRRSCPGSHIALSVIWLATASLLTVFNIEKAVDANGQPIEPTREYQSSAVSHPVPFQYVIRPRSKGAALLVQEAMELVDDDEHTKPGVSWRE